MLAYVTIVGSNVAPLAHLVRWYSYLGVEKFLLTFYVHSGQELQTFKIFEAESVKYEVAGLFDEILFTREHADKHIQSVHKEGTWAFFPDVDEFCRMTPASVRDAVAHGMPVIGHRRDRTTHNGNLIEIDPRPHLEVQFPYGLQFAKSVGLVQSPVYVLSNKTPTAHYVDHCSWGLKQVAAMQRGSVEVHQFRWHDGLPGQLRRRMTRMQQQGVEETPRTLQYLASQLEHLKRHQGVYPPLIHFVGSVVGI